MTEPSDAAARVRALDPTQSFIVQAPAGSGKTELLTQRFLRLLATVEYPEEVIALTFTRKAAAEMRERIVSALQQAAKNAVVDNDNDRLRMRLAGEVLLRDREQEWRLAANPQRLRVMTIDAFNGGLVRQMPLTAQLGATLNTTDKASAYYRESARKTIEYVQNKNADDGDYQNALATLLRYFDNRADRVEQQLVKMLQNREQWLLPIGATIGVDESSLRVQLEQNWRSLVEMRLTALQKAVPPALSASFPPLARFAAEQCRVSYAAGNESPLAGLLEMPSTHWEAVSTWSEVADLLLVAGKPAARKTVNKKQGFPSDKEHTEKKQAMLALLSSLGDHDKFVRLLHGIRVLPAGGYSDDRWQLLSALRKVLLLAVAQLQVEFATAGEIDHSENTLRALQALGDDDEPSDLALSLDYRIRHLLIDEFQDTSVSQFQLLERLIRGWQPADGRTLFLVGDPMQSIYRFRQAEVGEFLRARKSGVGDVTLTGLTLTQNFRSGDEVVNWVNSTFCEVFDAPENMLTGAVEYTPSVAHQQFDNAKISVHPALSSDAEAEQVVDTIQRCRVQNPAQKIAVLVRSRAHLSAIYPLLNQRSISYQNVDIEKLGELPVVLDLLSLTRALHHPADDIAWLSILRAPWCGLLLADLLALRDCGDLVSSAVLSDSAFINLSADAQARFQRLRAVLQVSIQNARRVPLARLVRATWLQLGGPDCVENSRDLAAADSFFELLAAAASGPRELSIADFSEQLNDRPAPLSAATDDSLQLMTIHKSKGLEFDTVLIPNLGRRGRNDDSPPIKWMQDVDGSLLLAPVKKPDEQYPDAMYTILTDIEREKRNNELKRLLYVAVTRAKSQVHLFGHASSRKEGIAADSLSLLHLIWPQVRAIFETALEGADISESTVSSDSEPPPIKRLPANWQLPAPAEALPEDSQHAERNAALALNNSVEFDWAGESARCIGTVVHNYLQRIADDGIEHWSHERIDSSSEHIGARLREEGIQDSACESSVKRCLRALHNALSDPHGQWVLQSHREAASEFSIAGFVDDDEDLVKRYVIDRTFVDEHGIRWIIDYKTGDHRGAGLEQFLDREQARYQAQLDGYAALMRHVDQRPIRLGLYFPVVQGWREWEAPG